MALDTAQERHVIVEGKEGKKSLSKLYFHKECWREIMVAKNQVSASLKKANRFLDFVGKKIGYEREVKI